MDTRFYPITPEDFRTLILPLIEGNYMWKGRPPSISHYEVFWDYFIHSACAPGTPWRDFTIMLRQVTADYTFALSAAANAEFGGIS